jgi:hypothetical protein
MIKVQENAHITPLRVAQALGIESTMVIVRTTADEVAVDTQVELTPEQQSVLDELLQPDPSKQIAELRQALNEANQTIARLKDAKSFVELREKIEEKPDVPPYRAGVMVRIGDVVEYGGEHYRVIQSHITQAGWNPSEVPALYQHLPKAQPGQDYPAWKQPAGGHDAYARGARVHHKSKNWENTIDANVWEPGVYGWVEV